MKLGRGQRPAGSGWACQPGLSGPRPSMASRGGVLGGSDESDVVVDDGGGTDRHHSRLGAGAERHLLWVGSGDLDELKPLLRRFSDQILEGYGGQLSTGAAPLAEPERREAGVVAHGQRTRVGDGEHGAETTIAQRRLAAVFDVE